MFFFLLFSNYLFSNYYKLRFDNSFDGWLKSYQLFMGYSMPSPEYIIIFRDPL